MKKLNLKANKAPEMALISKMGAGQTFEFTSAKKKENSGPYLKLNSKENKAVNLLTFKTFVFANTDKGLPFEAELNRIG